MPRKGTMTQDFNAEASIGATNQDIVDALNENRSEIKNELNEVHSTLKKTHLGHELFTWEAEVDEVE